MARKDNFKNVPQLKYRMTLKMFIIPLHLRNY